MGTTGVTSMVGSINSYYEILGSSNSHQLDYQIRAINGYLNSTAPFVPPIGIEPNDSPVIVVNTSEWSNTHTITLPNYVPPTTTPNPTANPTVAPSTEPTIPNTQTTNPTILTDFSTIEIILAAIAVTLIIIVVLLFFLVFKGIQKHSS